ncbi:asparaginase [Flavobacterium succinicans]|uniref:Asparaginase n=2 Tax=Flavobacteriaceae TaxID=49546 RepID=A0A1I4SPT6_9FLAO|nr:MULTISPECIES: type II asparaginase [Flavobacterium]SFM66313.1 asparaginase [Flavobacterium succinicans]
MMKKIISIVYVAILTFSIATNAQKNTDKNAPRIIILATGGTIAGSGESATKAAYTAGKVPIDDLLNAVPDIHKYGKISGEQIAQIGSQDMNVVTWLKLAKRINQIFKDNLADAVVVTHGTDTQGETAYFLDLTVTSDKPVVLVGAMRPSTAMSQDGNRNLLDAVMVAANPKSQGKGVIVAMDEKVFDARDVTKTSTTNLETFRSTNFGPIGLIYDGKVSYYYQSLRNPSKKFDVSKLNELPKVEIVYGYADASPETVSNLSTIPALKGLVYAGMGNGNFGEPVGKALADISKKGVVVCRSARANSGRITLENEVNDAELGFVVADDLNPQKARVLLMLSLTETSDRAKIQDNFFEY